MNPVRILFALFFTALWFYAWGKETRHNGRLDAACYSIVAVIVALCLAG